MKNDQPWPPVTVHLQSVWKRTVACVRDLITRSITPAAGHGLGGGTNVRLARVFEILLAHELSKHPERRPPGMTLTTVGNDYAALGSLLKSAGWPVRRVRRLMSLQWRETHLSGGDFEQLYLAPVPWVLWLGGGSSRAIDVARGARRVLETELDDPHLRAIRQGMTESPHPRILVVRQVGRRAVVEDGNHFVIATLLRFPAPDHRPPILCLVGSRPTEAHSVVTQPDPVSNRLELS